MKLYRTAFKKFGWLLPGFWGGVLGAVIVLAATFSLPGESCAAVDYGDQISYQLNTVDNGTGSFSTAQERFSFYFNLRAAPSSKLSITGALRFDVLQNENQGSSSTEFQPNLSLTLATRALQLSFGYRKIIRNEAIISGTSTSNLTSDSSDVYADTGINAGKLPSLRLRYSIRDSKQLADGKVTSDSATKDFGASINYRIGIISMNADYRTAESKNVLNGLVTTSTQVSGQVSMAQRLGTKIDFGLRENYNYSEDATAGETQSKRYSSSTEARMGIYPFRGASFSSNYVYRMSGDLFGDSGTSTEKTWFNSLNYSFPRFVRFYGSYSTRESGNPGSTSTDNVYSGGVGFSHSIGSLSFASRYEKYYQTSTSKSEGQESSSSSSSRDNIDLNVTARVARFLSLGLSQSYVTSTSGSQTNSGSRYRFNANIGPIKTLVVAPSVDYSVSTPPTGPETTTKELNIPASFSIRLHSKIDLGFSDNYRWGETDSGTKTSSSTSNTFNMRVNVAQPLPGTSLAGDASFSSSSSDHGPVVSTSSYSLRASWFKNPHHVDFNMRYQTGSNTVDSGSFAGQYGLIFKYKKLSMSFQARYDYSVTFSTPSTSSQSVYLILGMRK